MQTITHSPSQLLPQESLVERFYAYLALTDGQLETEMRMHIRAEHDLPEPVRYEAVLERLRAWLELSPEDARILARAYADALRTFPDAYGAEIQRAERAVLLNAMTFQELRVLATVLPWLCDGSWTIGDEKHAVALAA